MAGPPARAKAEGGGLQLARPWRGAAVARAVMCQSLCPRSGPGTAPALPRQPRRRHLGAPDAILLMPRDGGRCGGFFTFIGHREG